MFLNHAFDAANEYLYLSLIAGVVGSGMIPRSVLEIPPAEARLARLWGLISTCEYSLHDLSQVKLSAAGHRVPRFNMPFELGLAVAVALSANRNHQFRILEKVPFRINQSLSDMQGYDCFIHGGSAKGVLESIQDLFDHVKDRPLTEMSDLLRLYRDLARYRIEQLGGRDAFGRHAFGRLVAFARASVSIRAVAATK